MEFFFGDLVGTLPAVVDQHAHSAGVSLLRSFPFAIDLKGLDKFFVPVCHPRRAGSSTCSLLLSRMDLEKHDSGLQRLGQVREDRWDHVAQLAFTRLPRSGLLESGKGEL